MPLHVGDIDQKSFIDGGGLYYRGMLVRFAALLILVALVLMLTTEFVWAMGMGNPGPCVARNAIEVYCMNNGGCPKDGNCYFPDGSYCNLRSFYNGTCPGREYYEQAIWMSEAYRFLNEDIYSPYMPYAPYTPYMPNSYQYGNNYYYWPTYSPGYGPYWP